MKEGQRRWSREELLLAINLYCKMDFGRMHSRNPEIINLAHLIRRTPSSVAMKLVNFASLDPSLRARDITGMKNASRLDKEIWNEFYSDWDSLIYESEKLQVEKRNTTVEREYELKEVELPKEGRVRETVIKARVNQAFFRRLVLSSYNYTCCITGIREPSLLIAGHIRPWGLDENNRMNPRNGIALNALHDKAFENGLITITPDFKIKISSLLLKQNNDRTIKEYFTVYHNKEIMLPKRFLPDAKFLSFHNNNKFIP